MDLTYYEECLERTHEDVLPLAARAMTTETRGQNSYVNSLEYDEAFKIRDQA
jgi:hypothetical protein